MGLVTVPVRIGAWLLPGLLLACGESDPTAGETLEEESVEVTPAVEMPAFPTDLPTTRLRGRVIDTRTAQGLPELWVRLRRRGELSLAKTDERGYFFADRPVPEGKVSARVGFEPKEPWLEPGIFRLDHDGTVAEEMQHVLRVDTGPGYRLKFMTVPVRNPQRWKARLVERDAEGEERPWSWQTLRRGDLPWLRYPTVEFEPDPLYRARIELRLAGADRYSRAAVTRTTGVAEEPVVMELAQYAAFGGQVIDATGRPVVDAKISLFQLSGSALPVVATDWQSVYTLRSGAFFFEEGVEPGRYHLLVESAGRENVNLDLPIEEEGTSAYRIRLPEVPIAGVLSGVLRGGEAGAPPMALFSLRSIDGGGVRRWLHPLEKDPLWGNLTPEDGRLTFFFEDVPAGRLELSLFPLDGRAWEPRTVELDAPAEGLAFTCDDAAPQVTYHFEVHDAATGEPLEEFRAIFRAEGWWNPEGLLLAPGVPAAMVSPDSSFTWMVYQPGYRPRYGALPREVEGDVLSIPLELEPGWGAELWLRDARGGGDRPELDTWTTMARVHQAPPVSGEEIRADGVALGQSDANGVFRVSLDAEPRALEIGGAQWTVLDSTFFADRRIVSKDSGEYRSVVLWLRPVE